MILEMGQKSDAEQRDKALIIEHFKSRWKREYLRITGTNIQQVKIGDIILVS